jgi:hypothetical protein
MGCPPGNIRIYCRACQKPLYTKILFSAKKKTACLSAAFSVDIFIKKEDAS